MGEIISENELHKKYSVLDNKGDGNCLFLAVSQLDSKYTHDLIRKEVCNKWKELKRKNSEYYQIVSLSDDFIDDDGRNHDVAICDNYIWGSLQDVAIVAEILKRPIIVYSRITNTMRDGKKNKDYGKYVKLDEREPGTIFKENKLSSSSRKDPIYLKLTLKKNYGHYEAMILKTTSKNSPKSSTKKNKSKSKRKTSRNYTNTIELSSSSSTKKKKSKQKTTKKQKSVSHKSDSNDYLNSSYEDDIQEAIMRSLSYR